MFNFVKVLSSNKAAFKAIPPFKLETGAFTFQLLIFIFVLSCYSGLFSESGPAEAQADQTISIAVTIPPQAYFVSRIGGDAVKVETLMPANADHETYEPNMSQLGRLKGVQLFFRIGHPAFVFESLWLNKLLHEGGDKAAVVVDMFTPEQFIPGDIHVWESFAGGRSMAHATVTELKKLNPSRSQFFEENYLKLSAEIDELEKSAKQSLAWRKRASIVAYHPAWGYLCRELQVEQLAFEHEGKDPSPVLIAQILKRAKVEGITQILADRHAPQASVEMIASELHGKVVIVDPLEPDWLENMRRITTAISKALN